MRKEQWVGRALKKRVPQPPRFPELTPRTHSDTIEKYVSRVGVSYWNPVVTCSFWDILTFKQKTKENRRKKKKKNSSHNFFMLVLTRELGNKVRGFKQILKGFGFVFLLAKPICSSSPDSWKIWFKSFIPPRAHYSFTKKCKIFNNSLFIPLLGYISWIIQLTHKINTISI